MHHATDRLRYLYGLNGLGDAPVLQISPELMRMSLQSPASRQWMAQMFATASGSPDPTNVQQMGQQDASRCECALRETASHFQFGTEVMRDMQAACAADPEGFLVALDQQVRAQGVTLDYARCGGNGAAAWYKDPKKLGLAAVAGAAGIGLLWMVFR